MSKFPRSLVVAALTASAIAAGPLSAQSYPDKPIRIIIPNSPGTQVDTIARLVSNDMQKLLGQPVVVENKAGANGLVGYEYVISQTAPDGYTLVGVSPTSFASLSVTAKDLRFDPLKELPPVIGLVEGRQVLVTSVQLPWKTLPGMMAYAKANPGKLNYGEASFNGRVVVETVLRASGATATAISYKTSGQLYQAMVSGEVHLGMAAMAYNERYRILAVTGERRFPGLPDVPTFAELGFLEIPSAGVYFHIRAGTPQPIIDKLHRAVSKALDNPTLRAQIVKMDLEVTNDPPEVVAQKLARASQFYSSNAKKLGL